VFTPRVVIASSAIAVLSFVATACGGSSNTTAADPSTSSTAHSGSGSSTSAAPPTSLPVTTTTTLKDPCSYVTNAEVGSAIAKTVTASTKTNDFVCSYSTSDTGTVNVGVVSQTTRAIVEGQLKAETGAGTLPPTMAGLGDVAYQTLGGIAVVQGTKSVRVTVFGSGSYAANGNAGAVSLARLILSRM
jgi:hypothetical protein